MFTKCDSKQATSIPKITQELLFKMARCSVGLHNGKVGRFIIYLRLNGHDGTINPSLLFPVLLSLLLTLTTYPTMSIASLLTNRFIQPDWIYPLPFCKSEIRSPLHPHHIPLNTSTAAIPLIHLSLGDANRQCTLPPPASVRRENALVYWSVLGIQKPVLCRVELFTE